MPLDEALARGGPYNPEGYQRWLLEQILRCQMMSNCGNGAAVAKMAEHWIDTVQAGRVMFGLEPCHPGGAENAG